MNNIQLFEYSKKHPEEMFDSFYAKKKVIIPKDKNDDNQLIKNNNKLIELITAFKVLHESGFGLENDAVKEIINSIIEILMKTPNINYSAFSQFFMVYNSTFSYFCGLNHDEKISFIYEMLIRYCKERHEMYLNHGYSNIILQVMCDNYSHKRNSKTTIDKILFLLSPYRLTRLTNINDSDKDNYYFLPDKGDKILFNKFLRKYNIEMQSRKIEQDKLPDIVFKHNGQIYICELKSMKGSGGGQNKQIVEVAYFIKFSEDNQNIHYITFLDGEYSNRLFNSQMQKIKLQRKDIIDALNNNPNNYFLNTQGFKNLLENIFTKN